ncbi:YceH family protein [Salinisphaera hydrothermalis]|uniref:YceH family protein n=1 Tax=Salinisphaera hydrothermalis TaxID=563188 RepID=UPI00333ED44B
MLPKLTDVEARIIGCLMEKSVTTPDQMPLTLNALTNAANQKSAREPVMSLTRVEVQRAARALAQRSLVQIDENFKSGVEKYKQRMCGAGQFADIKLTKAQFAIVTLLLLRGPQTPGELRSRAGRLYDFPDNDAASAAARELIDEEGLEHSLLVQLPRTKGRKDAEFMHQLCGPLDLEAYAAAASEGPGQSAAQERIAALEQRVAELEAENAALREQLATERGA